MPLARVLLLSFAAPLAFAMSTARAADSQPPTAVAGWAEFVDGLKTLPDRLLSKLPAGQRADPQIQQEIGRIVLESLAASLIEAMGSDGDHPAFVANQNLTLNYPQPNADTIYRLTRVTPGGTYRIRGERGNLRLANIGQSGPMPGEPGGTSLAAGPKRAVFDLNALHVDAKGRFDVILSPTRPADYTGDWWELSPSTTRLLLRAVMADVGKERDPTISIERLDISARRARPTAEVLEQRLRNLPRAVALLPSIFVSGGERLRAEGYVNRFKLIDAAQNGGLAGQSYYSSVFDLGEDEALVIAVRPPTRCRYRSIQLASESQETFDWHDNQSSLNDVQAKPDKDGILRFVVAGRDPGVPNWLDTAGHARGIVEGRWMECDTTPVPTIEKVPLAELRQHLPADTPTITPAQRERTIRDRRSALQQRPLW